MRRRILSFGLLALALLLGCLWLGRVAYQELDRAQDLPAPVDFEVPKGANIRATADRLRAAGLLRWPASFEVYARWTGQAGALKAGRHRFAGRVSPRQVLDRITQAPRGGDVEVTLPEGLNRWEVAERLASAGVCSAAGFLAAAGPEAEGRLFPDTYRFFPGSDPARVRATLERRFEQVWGELSAALPQGLSAARKAGYGPAQLLTLASMVEEEAQVPEERALIARVFFNRLKKGWKLQSDPTCVYGESTWRQLPSPALCRDPKSRYSTYVIPGLPPGPISNPGRASLRAVLEPSQAPGSDALMFFVARWDGTGRHDFSATRQEHEAKVRKYLRPKP